MHLLFYGCFLLLFLQSTRAEPIKELDDCNKDYACYYAEPTSDLTGYELIKLKNPYSYNDPPSVVFKIHLYSQRHYRVVLQSYKSDIKSIKITRVDKKEKDSQGAAVPAINWLSCEEESNNEIVFKVQDKKVEDSDNSNTLPLRCESEINGKPEVLEGTAYHIILVADPKTVPAKIVKTDEYPIIFSEADFFCDPSKLIQNFDKAESKNAYAKVNVHLNNLYCSKQYSTPDDKLWRFEYRKEGTDDYVEVAKPICETVRVGIENKPLRKFVINGDKVDKADLRCVADAKYFCDYQPPSPTGTKGLLLTPPKRDSNPPEASSLSCPNSHPYFVMGKVGKKYDYVKDSPFECRSSMKKYTWYFGNQPLPETGTKGYCSKTLECDDIPKDKLKSISMKDKIPSCHDGGTLMVYNDMKSKQKVRRILCNNTEGKLYYIREKSDTLIQWDPTLNAYCDYDSVEKAVGESKEIAKSNTLTYAGGASLGVILITTGIILFITVRKRKQMKAKAEHIKCSTQLADSKSQRIAKNENKKERIKKEKEYKDGDVVHDTLIKSGTKSEIRPRKNTKKHHKNAFADDNVTTTMPALRTVQEDICKTAILENESWLATFDLLPDSYKVQFREKEKSRLNDAMNNENLIKERKTYHLEKNRLRKASK